MSEKHLSGLEWEVMNVVWKLGGKPTVREIWESAYPKAEKAYTTIHTVMLNLENKGFVTKEKIGLVYFYTPAKKRDAVVKKETKSFANKVFEGSSSAMTHHLIKSGSFTKDDITKLKDLISEREKEINKD